MLLLVNMTWPWVDPPVPPGLLRVVDLCNSKPPPCFGTLHLLRGSRGGRGGDGGATPS